MEKELINLFVDHYTVAQPMGVALVMGTWNFPLYLSIGHTISAIAAGNCVILKPSEMAPHSSAAVKKIFDSLD